MELKGLYAKEILEGFESTGVHLDRINVFFGANGAGKTRLLNCVSDSLNPRLKVERLCALLLKINPSSPLFEPDGIRKAPPGSYGDFTLLGNKDDEFLRTVIERFSGFFFEDSLDYPDFNFDTLLKWINTEPTTTSANLVSIWYELRERFFSEVSETAINTFLKILISDLFFWHDPDRDSFIGHGDWILYGRINRSYFINDCGIKVEHFLSSSVQLNTEEGKFSKINFREYDLGVLKDIRSTEFLLIDDDHIYFPLVTDNIGNSSVGFFDIGWYWEYLPYRTLADDDRNNLSYNLTHAIGNIANSIETDPDNPLYFSSPRWGDLSEYKWYTHDNDSGGPNGAVRMAAFWLHELATNLLPSFISDEFTFAFTFKAPDDISKDDRIDVSLHRKTDAPPMVITFDEKLDLDDLLEGLASNVDFNLEDAGSGIYRWITLVLSIAVNIMLSSPLRLQKRNIGESSYLKFEGGYLSRMSMTLDSEENKTCFMLDASQDLRELQKWQVIPDFSVTELIIDEPEAFLHPAAISSVCKWLQTLSILHSARMFIATHSPEIFNITGQNLVKFNVKRVESKGKKICIYPRILHPSVLDDFMKSVGVTDGQATLMVTKWLFVEGYVDKVILEEWFLELFNNKGIRVISGQGVRDLEHLFELQVIPAVGGNIAVMIDKESREGISGEKKLAQTLKNKGKNSLGIPESRFSISLGTGFELTNQTDIDSRYISIAKHSKQDIFLHLDIEAIRNWAADAGVKDRWEGFKPWPLTWNSWNDVEESFSTHVESDCTCKALYDHKLNLSKKLWVQHLKVFFYNEVGIAWSVENAKTFASISPPTLDFAEFFTSFIETQGATWGEFLNKPDSAIYQNFE